MDDELRKAAQDFADSVDGYENDLPLSAIRAKGALRAALAKNASAAPQREWQGLTAEQVNDVRRRFATNISVPYFVMIYTAIEAALKEKNHG